MDIPKPLIEYSNNIQDVYKNIEEYNTGRKCNALIIFNDMIVDMLSNKKFNRIVTELFFRERELNMSAVFIKQSYFPVPEDVRPNCTHFLLWKLQTIESFNSHLIIHQILTLKALKIFTKNVLQNYIPF